MSNENKISKTVWSKGRYEKIGSKLTIVAENLCEEMNLRAGSKVLDIATGHGNAAMAASRRECKVYGIDTELELLQLAKKRSEIDMLDIEFSYANVESLPFSDASFDYILSTFGIQFASDHFKSAKEILRVIKPNGIIGFANWVLDGFAFQFAEIIASFSPQKPASSPYSWSDDAALNDYFQNQLQWIENSVQYFYYRFPKVDDWFHCFEHTYGPIMQLCQTLDDDQYQQLKSRISEAVARHNIATDGTLALPVPYKRQIAVIRKN